jgi:hypothetical protein
VVEVTSEDKDCPVESAFGSGDARGRRASAPGSQMIRLVYFIPSAMTRFIVSVFPFRNRVSFPEAFEGLELGEGKLSRPVLRGLGGRKAARLLGSYQSRPAHPEI